MTVQELIEKLSVCNPENLVIIGLTDTEIRNFQALEIIECGEVEESDFFEIRVSY